MLIAISYLLQGSYMSSGYGDCSDVKWHELWRYRQPSGNNISGQYIISVIPPPLLLPVYQWNQKHILRKLIECPITLRLTHFQTLLAMTS